jgi:hypothetical protein
LKAFTLDTNCLFAVDESRPEAADVRALASAHQAGQADVAVVAISASENRQGGGSIEDFSDFRARLSVLGLGHLEILPTLDYWDIAFWGRSLWASAQSAALERSIHDVLFPNVEFAWQDYCRVNGLNPLARPSGRWRNCKCDVLAMWSHIHFERDVFVTRDGKFHAETKKPALIALGANLIETPASSLPLI